MGEWGLFNLHLGNWYLTVHLGYDTFFKTVFGIWFLTNMKRFIKSDSIISDAG